MENNMGTKHSRLIIAPLLVSLALSSPLFAQQKIEKEKLEEVVVTATRTENALSDVANTVTVISEEQIEREMTNGIDDLIRYEPGVSVTGGGRFGLSGFTIRGIGGDRVLTLVDSTPTADEFTFGPFLSSRRDFVDVDAIKAVEIVRGPGSSVYGSNAIGGTVNFTTKQPSDYLQDRAYAGSVKVGSSTIDNGLNATSMLAVGNQKLSAMAVVTLRDNEENQNYFSDDLSGTARKSNNPQTNKSTNLYAKLHFVPSEDHRFSLVAEKFNGDTDTDVTTAVGTSKFGTITNSQLANDQRNRTRFSVAYQYKGESTILDSANIMIYTQDSETEQQTIFERVSRGKIQDRNRNSFFAQKNSGIRLQFVKNAELGSTKHLISYGADYDKNSTSTLRTGQTIDRESGQKLREFSNFPTRDFPNSKYTSLGLFLQDEISITDNFKLIPGVRNDSFKLTPTADAIYLSGNTGSPTPEGFDESKTSKKLGAIYDFNDQWSVFSQYTEGFRAPPIDAVNAGFTNFASGYTALPNPNLKPESGKSVELGIRKFGEYSSVQLVAYRNTYQDFIQSLAVKGFNPATQLLEFQAKNLDEAQIKGVELKSQYQLAAISESLQGFETRFSVAKSSGEDKTTGTPINTIDPLQAVLGVAYLPSDGRWGMEAILTYHGKKKASDIDASSLQRRGEQLVAPFEPDSAAVIDLIGHVNLNDKSRINWGVFNLTDKRYFSWSEALVRNPNNTNLDRLTAPGRNFSVTYKYNF